MLQKKPIKIWDANFNNIVISKLVKTKSNSWTDVSEELIFLKVTKRMYDLSQWLNGYNGCHDLSM